MTYRVSCYQWDIWCTSILAQALVRKKIFCTEPFRVPVAGKVMLHGSIRCVAYATESTEFSVCLTPDAIEVCNVV